jgi:chemotaxis protein CheZ
VVATLKTIDARIAQIVATFGSNEQDALIQVPAEPYEAALLNGPQHPTVAMHQSDIDRLLASFE